LCCLRWPCSRLSCRRKRTVTPPREIKLITLKRTKAERCQVCGCLTGWSVIVLGVVVSGGASITAIGSCSRERVPPLAPLAVGRRLDPLGLPQNHPVLREVDVSHALHIASKAFSQGLSSGSWVVVSWKATYYLATTSGRSATTPVPRKRNQNEAVRPHMTVAHTTERESRSGQEIWQLKAMQRAYRRRRASW
jgi:hypothetical protein